jgi:hypothetical protein
MRAPGKRLRVIILARPDSIGRACNFLCLPGVLPVYEMAVSSLRACSARPSCFPRDLPMAGAVFLMIGSPATGER